MTGGRKTRLLYSMQELDHHRTVNQLFQERMQRESTQNLALSVIICVSVGTPSDISLP